MNFGNKILGFPIGLKIWNTRNIICNEIIEIIIFATIGEKTFNKITFKINSNKYEKEF